MALKGTELIEKRNVLNELRRNSMVLQELRFFSIYLSKINARDIKTRKVSFPLEDFKKMMDIDKVNIWRIKQITDSLLCKVVHIDNDIGGYKSFQLFKECDLVQDEYGQWFVEIDAHDKALPLMFDFKREYFTYELWNALRLKSSNQIRMYELLKQYERIGIRKIPIERLKDYLGISSKEYSRWDNFKIRVLDSCKQALEEYTDIKFTYEPIKVGRKFTGIEFHISKNDNYIDRLTLDEFIDIKSDTYEVIENAITENHESSTHKVDIKKAEQDLRWHFSLQIAERNKDKVRTTVELYAMGVLKEWDKKGLITVEKLVEFGEISQEEVDEKKILEKYQSHINNF